MTPSINRQVVGCRIGGSEMTETSMIEVKIALTLLFIISGLLARKGEALGLALALVGVGLAFVVLP